MQYVCVVYNCKFWTRGNGHHKTQTWYFVLISSVPLGQFYQQWFPFICISPVQHIRLGTDILPTCMLVCVIYIYKGKKFFLKWLLWLVIKNFTYAGLNSFHIPFFFQEILIFGMACYFWVFLFHFLLFLRFVLYNKL